MPADERGEREPVEAQPASRDQGHARDQEQEVEDELDHPLRPLGERLRGLEVEPPDQVHEEEREEERERDGRRAREPPVEALGPVHGERDDEQEGHDVRERHRPGDLPLELRERDREDRREEEPLDQRGTLDGGARSVEGERGHGRVMVRGRSSTGSDQPGGSTSSQASSPAPRASATELAPCAYD